MNFCASYKRYQKHKLITALIKKNIVSICKQSKLSVTFRRQMRDQQTKHDVFCNIAIENSRDKYLEREEQCRGDMLRIMSQIKLFDGLN